MREGNRLPHCNLSAGHPNMSASKRCAVSQTSCRCRAHIQPEHRIFRHIADAEEDAKGYCGHALCCTEVTGSDNRAWQLTRPAIRLLASAVAHFPSRLAG